MIACCFVLYVIPLNYMMQHHARCINYIALHCIALDYVVWYIISSHTMLYCSIVHYIKWYGGMLFRVATYVSYCFALHHTLVYCAMLCGVSRPYDNVSYSIVLHCITVDYLEQHHIIVC